MTKGIKMKQSHFVTLMVSVGVAVPVLWLLILRLHLMGYPDLLWWIRGYHYDRALIAVWPSWLLLIADPENRNFTLQLTSVIINAVMYGALGWLIWIGLYRYRIMLGVTISALLIGWYFLLSWYTGG